ncbi:hypothetical protein CMI37_15545 [Candidatus Pacearchaeota archaeon]|nr:hypothetical protein [Candidatus Pacearchaeota archaeon]
MEVYKEVKKDFVRFCVVFLILSLTVNYCSSKDSTDGKKRSGMSLRIDNLTGCHYLESKEGYLILRLDKTGKHICKKELNYGHESFN